MVVGFDYFEQVIVFDFQFVLVYVGIVDFYILFVIYGFVFLFEVLLCVVEVVMMVLKIDLGVVEVFVVLIWVEWIFDLDWEVIEEGF